MEIGQNKSEVDIFMFRSNAAQPKSMGEKTSVLHDVPQDIISMGVEQCQVRSTIILPEYCILQLSRHIPPHLRRRVDILRAIIQPPPCKRDIFESDPHGSIFSVRPLHIPLVPGGNTEILDDLLNNLGKSEALETGGALAVEVEES